MGNLETCDSTEPSTNKAATATLTPKASYILNTGVEVRAVPEKMK